MTAGHTSAFFVANNPRLAKLGLFTTSSGALVRWLLSEPYQGMNVVSTDVDSHDAVWATLNSGPACTSGIAGCGPKPASCAGRVITISPSTGVVTTVLEAPSTALIAGAKLSPNGRYLAYLSGRCDRSYFNQHVEVTDLARHTSWSIGAGLNPCHRISSLSWTPDSTRLAAAYGASKVSAADTSPYNGAGICSEPAQATLTIVPALTGQPGFNGVSAAAETDCAIDSVAATTTGYAAIEQCAGHSHHDTFPVRLMHFSTTLQRTPEATLGQCGDGTELAASHDGKSILGTTYQFCNPPGTIPPHTVAFVADHNGVRTIYRQPNGGMDTFQSISW